MKVKICGITSEDDAEWALECGADALGFIFQPESKRYVGASDAQRIPARLEPFTVCVAVFGLVPNGITLPTRFNAIQGENTSSAQGVTRIEAIRIQGSQKPNLDIEADALLLDAFDPNAYGGTGKTIDWNLAAEIVRESPLPVILAGGLTPENVAEAIRIVKPYAVDVCSGVEASYGIKDKLKVRDFIQAAKGVL